MSKTIVWAIMALGILLLLASFVGLFFLFPLAIILLLIGVLLGLKPGGILRTEQVMDSWSILIENGQGKADEVAFTDTENDNYTWQRYPNGEDSWEFRWKTKGYSNGG